MAVAKKSTKSELSLSLNYFNLYIACGFTSYLYIACGFTSYCSPTLVHMIFLIIQWFLSLIQCIFFPLIVLMGTNVFLGAKDFLFLNVYVALNLLVGRAAIKPKHGDKRDQDGLH